MLPKIHKDLLNPPVRPIISGNDTVVEPASKFIDYFIKPIVSSLPAFLQDTTYVLKKLDEIGNIGDAFFVTMDVESLYTNTDHNEGLEALKLHLNKRPVEDMPPSDFIVSLTKWTINSYVFMFQDQLLKQVKGTAMGVAYAPSYTGLFLGLWEEKYIYSPANPFLDKVKWFGRYTDDLVFIFDGNEQELLDSHKYLNSTNSNIKLILEYSKSEINFADLNVSKDHYGNIHTLIFRKRSDQYTILRSDSFHPSSLNLNIPFG